MKKVRKVDIKSVFLLDQIVAQCFDFLLNITTTSVNNDNYKNFKAELLSKIDTLKKDMAFIKEKLKIDIEKLSRESFFNQDKELENLIKSWTVILKEHLKKVSNSYP